MPVPANARPPLSQPLPGEEVVISGIAGCFPDSENVYQFRDNLINKVNMMTIDDRRWKLGRLLFNFKIE
jgi:fatty acid synthase